MGFVDGAIIIVVSLGTVAMSVWLWKYMDKETDYDIYRKQQEREYKGKNN
tara:strand:- start:748 stop:897 length:150 start_codon:yes stop_codon:yes gene_type:complete